MSVHYYKRFRMEFNLRRAIPSLPIPPGYRLLPWQDELIDHHATVKCRSFSGELDSYVFPCLGDSAGCSQLMHEIVERPGFMPSATWLAVFEGDDSKRPYYAATIQGLCTSDGIGSIQNVGTVPEHRGNGLGGALVLHTLRGFKFAGLRRAYLEVTAQNVRAVRLYTRLGFRHARTVYKAVEAAYS